MRKSSCVWFKEAAAPASCSHWLAKLGLSVRAGLLIEAPAEADATNARRLHSPSGHQWSPAW